MDCFEERTFFLRNSLVTRKVGKVIASDGKF